MTHCTQSQLDLVKKVNTVRASIYHFFILSHVGFSLIFGGDWRYFFEIARLLKQSGYCHRAVIASARTVHTYIALFLPFLPLITDHKKTLTFYLSIIFKLLIYLFLVTYLEFCEKTFNRVLTTNFKINVFINALNSLILKKSLRRPSLINIECNFSDTAIQKK